MATWYGQARSNYFRVKDEDEFARWVESVRGLELISDGEGRLGLLSTDEFGHWPVSSYNEETEEDEDIDVFGEVASRLQEGSVAVFVEVGAEKMRYLTGFALAVNSKGEETRMDLGEIYERAKSLGEEITCAEY